MTLPVDVYTERRLGPPHVSLRVVSNETEQRSALTLSFPHKPYYSHFQVPEQRRSPNNFHRLVNETQPSAPNNNEKDASRSGTSLTALCTVLNPCEREIA